MNDDEDYPTKPIQIRLPDPAPVEETEEMVGEEEQIHPPQAAQEDEDQAYFENPLEIIREMGNHAGLEGVQRVIMENLRATSEKVKFDLIAKTDQLKALATDREALGVQLYGLQQQLARVQLMLENAHNEYNTIVDARLAEEDMLKDVNRNNTEQTALLNEYTKQQKKHADELEKMNETIRQIEEYNEQVKSEIAINRRAAYKVEANMAALEKDKEAQDLFVDHYNRQIKKVSEQIELVKKALDVQKKDVSEASAVILDTASELDLIATEKAQLMIQWKAALSGLSRRDEALAQATVTLSAAESAVHDYDVEIEASRRDLARQQAHHESLVNLRDRMENELNWVEESLSKMKAERASMQERYTLLSKSLAQTEAESKKLDVVTKQLSNETDSVIQNLQVVTQERQKMEEELTVLWSTHSNVNKAVTNYDKDTSKVIKHIHNKENDGNVIENDIARLNVEKLNLQAINDTLRDGLAVAAKELQEKESLSNKYMLEIRQRNDEIEKKMYRVDRLNKKYEKMVETAGGEENLGPLENTIKNLQKEIESINSECSELEREWLIKQTEMVNMSAEANAMHAKNNEQQARVTVLSQQQVRFTNDLRTVKNTLKSSRLLNADYQKDVSKLNALISGSHEAETSLQAANFIQEMDCIEALKEAEHTCFSLQSSIQEIKSNKAALLDEIVEMERQGMLWEKRIQLDKETRQALDPTVGVAESENMEKEIHRMELRLDALKREEARLSAEMTAVVEKRTTIASRYAVTKSADKKGGMTQANAKTRIAELRRVAAGLDSETANFTAAYNQKATDLTDMTFELERMTAQYGEAEEVCHSLQGNINDLLYQKQLNQERVSYRQKFCSRLREVSAQGVDIGQALQIERKLLASSQALENVREIIEELQATYPHLKDVLQRVLTMTDPDLEAVLVSTHQMQ